MGLRVDSARPQRVSGSARTDNQCAESARNPIASHVNFGDDSALSAFTRTQWTAAFKAAVHWPRVGAIITEFNMGGYQYALTADALSSRYPLSQRATL